MQLVEGIEESEEGSLGHMMGRSSYFLRDLFNIDLYYTILYIGCINEQYIGE